jgi:transposase-like protein
MRTSREEWCKRVERWKESGLTAEQYAAELGINPRTLQFWQYKLRRASGASKPHAGVKRGARKEPLPLVEVHSTVTDANGFELELGGSKRLRIPSGFNAAALERLLIVLGRVQ